MHKQPYQQDSISTSSLAYNIYDLRPNPPGTSRTDKEDRKIDIKISKNRLEWVGTIFKYIAFSILLPFTVLLYYIPKFIFPLLDSIPNGLVQLGRLSITLYKRMKARGSKILNHPISLLKYIFQRTFQFFHVIKTKILNFCHKKLETIKWIGLKISRLIVLTKSFFSSSKNYVWSYVREGWKNIGMALASLSKIKIAIAKTLNKLKLWWYSRNIFRIVLEYLLTVVQKGKAFGVKISSFFSVLKRYLTVIWKGYLVCKNRSIFLIKQSASFIFNIVNPFYLFFKYLNKRRIEFVKYFASKIYTFKIFCQRTIVSSLKKVVIALSKWLMHKINMIVKPFISVLLTIKNIAQFLSERMLLKINNITAQISRNASRMASVKSNGKKRQKTFFTSTYWLKIKKGLYLVHFSLDVFLLSIYEIPKQIVLLLIEWYKEMHQQFPLLRRFWS